MPSFDKITFGIKGVLTSFVTVAIMGAGYSNLQNSDKSIKDEVQSLGETVKKEVVRIDESINKEVKRIDTRIDKNQAKTELLDNIVANAMRDIAVIKKGQENLEEQGKEQMRLLQQQGKEQTVLLREIIKISNGRK